jgi:hypothetical protein
MKFDENKDGTMIVTLDAPVVLGGEEISRLSVPKLRGKHLRNAPWGLTGNATLGQLCEFAASIVLPEGAFDELDATDARDVALHVGGMLGKRRATGDEPSPS